MTDAELADELILRLNKLIEDPATKAIIGLLIEERAVVHDLGDHSPIQTQDGAVGFLGALNGLVGQIPEGARKGWGYITAVIEDDGSVTKFMRTVENPSE